jgi:hypothetical protein
MRRNIMRRMGREFCRLEIELTDGRLSVCGSAGVVMSRKDAKKEGISRLESYFDGEPEARREINERCGMNCHTSRGAAIAVLRQDGEFSGLDVVTEDGEDVYVGHSFGQIREEMLQFFPDAAPLFPWHLNDMRAGCEHQDTLGWKRGHTVALDRTSCTDVQLHVLDAELAEGREKRREKEYAARVANDADARRWARDRNGGTLTMSELEEVTLFSFFVKRPLRRQWEAHCREQVKRDMPNELFEGQVFHDSLMAPCPVCGYRYGSAWTKRELPAEIVKLAETIGAEDKS